ncbi:FCD domain-containing protein [Paracoccus beibuensis]|uniref:FCD domain-containing protein n=1 Tax=Paracoccus beibuensis TaxID=547602 RepID=UPI00223ED689|nr:FCD domain-containing protein [Paracoccus beibuensis]
MARQAHFLRRPAEIETLRLLDQTHGADEMLDASETLQKRMNLRLDNSKLSSFDERGRTFHHAILATAGVPDVTAVVRRNSGHIDRLRRLSLLSTGKAAQIIRDHGS